MYRQAYLIIAHRYDETFKTLLQMLDSDENDIFVHMDKKNKQFDEKECRGLVKRSGLFFAERTSVTWGGYSQINSEMSSDNMPSVPDSARVPGSEPTRGEAGYDRNHVFPGRTIRFFS